MAALATKSISVSFQPELHWNILPWQGVLQPHSCGQDGCKWMRKHLQAGKNKACVCYFKGTGRSQTQQDKSTSRASKACSEECNKSVLFLVPNFNQIVSISEKTGRQLWMHYPFSPIHISYSQVLDKVVANLLSSTETLGKSWKYSARHPHIWQGWKRPFCQCTNIPFLSLNNPENQKCSGENNIMRGYPEKKRQPTPQAGIWNHTATNSNSKEVLGCTHLFSGAIRFLLPLWPEHASALILPGRLFPGVTLTEMRGCAPRINLA